MVFQVIVGGVVKGLLGGHRGRARGEIKGGVRRGVAGGMQGGPRGDLLGRARSSQSGAFCWPGVSLSLAGVPAPDVKYYKPKTYNCN